MSKYPIAKDCFLIEPEEGDLLGLLDSHFGSNWIAHRPHGLKHWHLGRSEQRAAHAIVVLKEGTLNPQAWNNPHLCEALELGQPRHENMKGLGRLLFTDNKGLATPMIPPSLPADPSLQEGLARAFGTSSGAMTIGAHRLSLYRNWTSGKGTLGWVMLNPSTADFEIDDPTIRRCIGFAKRWGFSGIHVCNLFTRRATKPKELHGLKPSELNHEIADDRIRDLVGRCSRVVVAWGANGDRWPERVAEVHALLGETIEVVDLGTTKLGQPVHPLYIPWDRQPEPWTRPTRTQDVLKMSDQYEPGFDGPNDKTQWFRNPHPPGVTTNQCDWNDEDGLCCRGDINHEGDHSSVVTTWTEQAQ